MLRRFILMASALCLWGWSDPAFGQTGPRRLGTAASVGQAGSPKSRTRPGIAQSSWFADDEPDLMPPLKRVSPPQAAAAAPAGGTAETEYEPLASPVATWGSFNQPPPPDIQPPTVEYTQVHPAHGIIQEEDGHEYQKFITTPQDIFPTTSRDGYEFINLYRPDGLAPIGVIGDHTLNAGGQMLVSYRYERLGYDGNLDGTNALSTSDVLKQFPIAATGMLSETHRFLAEYATSEDLTFMVQLPLVHDMLHHTTASGGQITTDTTDLGDVQLTALYVLKRWNRQQIHLNFGVSIPVGSLDALDTPIVPGSPDGSYPTRMSSGDWGLLPGITYRGQSDWYSWGAQAIGTTWLGRNRYDYAPGDQVNLNLWGARRWCDYFSSSFRLQGLIMSNVQGADPRLDQTLVQTNRPDLQAGQRLNVLFGANFYLPDGRFPGQRISIEGGIPAYQSLSGPQLRQNYLLTVGWQMIF